MDTPTIETPATPATPVDVAELSFDQIVAQELSAADNAGEPVIEGEGAVESTEEKTPAETPSGKTEAPVETPAEEPAVAETPDQISAARARKILAKAEETLAKVEAKEKSFAQDFFKKFLQTPNAALSEIGASIDDVIDASIAERKGTPIEAKAPAADDRLAALEARITAREKREEEARTTAEVNARISEIHGAIKASGKFPEINRTGKASVVTEVMQSYFQQHGKPITWDRAAALVEADLKAIRGSSLPVKAAAPAERPDTVSLSGDVRTTAPADDEEPSDPSRLMAYLVAKAGL